MIKYTVFIRFWRWIYLENW